MIFNGKEVAAAYKQKIIEVVQQLKAHGSVPKLAVIQLMEEDGLDIYLKSRVKMAGELGIFIEPYKLTNPTVSDIYNLITTLNSDKSVWGIMIDRPIPQYLSEEEIIDFIDPSKDVEGDTLRNAGKLMHRLDCPVAPTAQAIIRILKYYDIDLVGANVTVVGRSKSVGQPAAELFAKEDATVTLCHSKTKDLKRFTSTSDVVVIAIGQKEFIKSEFVSENSTIIDIGTHYGDDGKIVGDIDRLAYKKAKNVCPSPGGVGPVTNVMLFYNLLKLREAI